MNHDLATVLYATGWIVAGLIVALAIIVAAHFQERRQWWRCAWCGRFFNDLGETRSSMPSGLPEPLSTGCCEVCAVRMKRELPHREAWCNERSLAA